MSKEESHISLTGRVISGSNGVYNVEVSVPDAQGGVGQKNILCHPGGKLRKHSINIIKGDVVDISVSVYDLNKGIITYRHKA
jgi:translation initiation factor IF-1